MKISLICLFSCFLLMVAFESSQAADASCPFIYEEGDHASNEVVYMPSEWGMCEGAAACHEGMAQSPIDINTDEVMMDKEMGPLMFNWHTLHKVDLSWSGYNQVFSSSWEEQGHPSQLHHMMLEEEFHLLQFHLHTPSEHTVDGELMAFEIHFVHTSETGEVAVVGFFGEVGDEDDWSDFMDNMLGEDPSSEAGTEGLTYRLSSLSLPMILAELPNHDYYHYKGSFTTPPCTEGVYFFVMKEPIVVHPSQLERLSGFQPVNNRPTQPWNDRMVRLYSSSHCSEVGKDCDTCKDQCKKACNKTCENYDDDCSSTCKTQCKKKMCSEIC